ncbi:MAG: caspase family protein [Gammaproteobacteria bacterium]|nr:caspase family protein [Gammaproteobacteria bacterium]
MLRNKTKRRIAIVCACLGMLYTGNAIAEKHALLIGVGAYPTRALTGPVNDVNAVQKVLIKKWGFDPDKIDVVLDKEGTHDNIIRKISQLHSKTKKGDSIFIYMSGHGTSAHDSGIQDVLSDNTKGLERVLPTTSGAFIPVDVFSAGNREEIVDRLIVGKRDLRPLFTALDESGRDVFVVIDACFSGNTVRSRYKVANTEFRSMNISEVMSYKGLTDDLDWLAQRKKPETTQQAEPEQADPYPYKNIYYLSAAGEDERALDIPPKLLPVYPTVDGKPHGAFTDSLLRILHGEINADLDQDGRITYGELKTSVRNLMRIRGFEHTPQALPSLAEDKGNLAYRELFSTRSTGEQVSARVTKQKVQSPRVKTVDIGQTPNIVYQRKFPVYLDSSLDPKLRKILGEITDIAISSDAYQLEIRQTPSHVLLLSNAGDLIAKVKNGNPAAIKDAVINQATADLLVHGDFSQSFEVELDMLQRGRGSTAVLGEEIGFSIRTNMDAYVLLLNIDPAGLVSVIYPYLATELNSVAAFEALQLDRISEVRPPFGRDYVIAYAFGRNSELYEGLRGKSFYLGSEEFKKLFQLLNAEEIPAARASLQLVTADGVAK